jgi:HD-GYP domain-containing protein (c-di-GMP phosphodiesterase class II)
LLGGSARVVGVVGVGADAARKNAQALFLRTSDTVAAKVESLVQRPVDLALYAALDGDAGHPVWGDGLAHPFFPFMKAALEASPTLYSVSVAGADGSFFQVIQTNGDHRTLASLRAPGGTRYVVRTVGAGNQTQRWTFVGAGVLGQRVEAADRSFTNTAWYRSARAGKGVVLSEPYTLANLGDPGITASIARPDGRVVAVDLPLASLQTFLGDLSVSANGGIRVQNQYGTILAQSVSTERQDDDLSFAVDKTLAGLGLRLVFWAPLDDFGAEFRTMEASVVVTTLILLLVLIPLTLAFTRQLTRIVTDLSADVDRVCQMDFGGVAPHGSMVKEFDRLARGFGTMKGTLSSETAKLAEAQLKLKKIVETGIALSTEKDSNALCQKILDTAKELTDADGGTLYLLNENETFLDFNIMLNDTLGTRFGGTSGRAIPPGLRVQLFQDGGDENHHNVASHAFLTGETVNIQDAYNDDRFDFSGTKKFDEANGYRSQSFLTIPLKPMGGEVLGCLQLINAKGPDGKTNVPFTQDMQDFVEALAASAATAIYNRHLLDDLEQLFDAIIDVINGALGRKSPYTGGHCERVPVIAKMLAEATSAVTEGPLAGFSLDDRGMREFELAAKLHDVGKVTTPEYVVDKSTKLETIYNRIHEVRTRFEVLYRDALIRRHEAVLADPSQAARADAELAAFKATLDAEWAFLALSNQGGEFLSPEKIERIKTIGARTWVRYFDDRLGLSWEEEARLKDVPRPTLPAPTTLLADEPRHIFARQIAFDEAYKTPDGSPYPFKTPVPALLYNQGEVYNLSVSRGTLTNEEHFKIKEHVMQSIYMLDRLPWPQQLKNVSVIAGQHHETLVGTGYPCQATATELSMQSRILTLADIFEALTASDRPYKKAKSLSEAVKILFSFKKDQHIDADLFDLFLTSGVYRQYAERYLAPGQLDEVDITPYLGPVHQG